MGKYKITFRNKEDRSITKNIPTKAAIASVGQFFDKNKVQYEAKEYKKKEVRKYGNN